MQTGHVTFKRKQRIARNTIPLFNQKIQQGETLTMEEVAKRLRNPEAYFQCVNPGVAIYWREDQKLSDAFGIGQEQ